MPENDTPEGAIQRFIVTYERMDSSEYVRLFTGNFQFEFSNSADPDLVLEYAAGWFKEDEQISATNLFNGGVNKDGFPQSAAQSIELDLTTTTTEGDTIAGRYTTKYRVLLTPIQLVIEIPPSPDNPDGTTFILGGADPAVHRFFLVRGDAADGLDAEQPADSLHWYLWHWRDETTGRLRARSGGSDARSLPSMTWGELKAIYR